jgi:hypothetical protein
MSKTVASVHQAVVPSSPRLPLEHLGFSIANRRPFSRDFFNSILGQRSAMDKEIMEVQPSQVHLAIANEH